MTVAAFQKNFIYKIRRWSGFGLRLVSCGLSGGSAVKNPPAHAGEAGLIGSGRSPGEGNGNPL